MKLQRKLKGAYRFARSRFTENSAILLYHRVAPRVADPFSLCVDPGQFAEQMERLRQFATPLPIAEFACRQREGRLDRRSVAVTFDDGCLDVLQNALPVLERFEIPAVIYFVSGNLGRPFWWNRLAELLLGVAPVPDEIRLGANGSGIEIGTRHRRDAFDEIYRRWIHREAPQRDEELAQLEAAVGAGSEASDSRSMSADEIRTLSAHPLVTIGAHTVSHCRLASRSPEEQYDEIRSSVEQLATITGGAIDSFSYPFGIRGRDYSAETVEAARRAGLDHALAADTDVVSPPEDGFALPRLWVHDADGARFERRLRRWLRC